MFRAAPGARHEADLEEYRVGALVRKEHSKPPGQRDEELVHTLRVRFFKLQLANAKARAAKYANYAVGYAWPAPWQQCCAAAAWVRQRAAASYRALHDFYSQIIQQGTEELAAAQARRPAVIAAEPTLHLDLSGALQQQPPRLDMCRACARWLEQLELNEYSCSAYADVVQKQFHERGMHATPATAAASPGAAAAAATAPDVPVGQQGQQQQCSGGDSDAGGAEGAPDTPKQPPQPQQQQQQHTSSDREQQQQQHTSSDQEQRQEWDAADERRAPLPETQG
ncbi:hypothetical protein C2E20_1529 [Micractinium conductrix]|uniref:Uncharacterized protein n=1 Tax=Micractinium conductrix TaxID=554055 RepID=A0A2P6VNZ6_9CHLO|nr:hypothetical protein C2E20_1529 [Micractinium conductrix]|eukprot:PSC75789.1 hypothetical protein C2E20_1529 [Micractinium conductrix]